MKVEDRFWKYIDKKEPNACWLWRGTLCNGYGLFWDGKRNVRAHRYMLFYMTGVDIPSNLDVCHKCGNSLCCNPAHLEVDTRQVNIEDRTRHIKERICNKFTESDFNKLKEVL
jgi:hypothetical protein